MATEIEEASPAIINGDAVRSLYDAVRALPIHAVVELLSIEVCTRCILRLFGARGSEHYRLPLSTSMLSSVFSDLDNLCGLGEPAVCRLCLGILQFTYREDKNVVKKKSVDDLAASICVLIREQGFQIDSFYLEASVPTVVVENENIVW